MLRRVTLSLGSLWDDGALARAFVVLAALAIAGLLAALVRSRTGHINEPAFAAQLRKLVTAGNPDRAIKLCHVADYPVALVARAGLEAARAAVRGDAIELGAGYREPGARDPASVARAAMNAMRGDARANPTRGFLPARVLGGVACALGVAVAWLEPGSTPTAMLMVSGIVLLLFVTWQVARSDARGIAAVTRTVAELAEHPGMRAQ